MRPPQAPPRQCSCKICWEHRWQRILHKPCRWIIPQNWLFTVYLVRESKILTKAIQPHHWCTRWTPTQMQIRLFSKVRDAQRGGLTLTRKSPLLSSKLALQNLSLTARLSMKKILVHVAHKWQNRYILPRLTISNPKIIRIYTGKKANFNLSLPTLIRN